jgi:hypothetical protein
MLHYANEFSSKIATDNCNTRIHKITGFILSWGVFKFQPICAHHYAASDLLPPSHNITAFLTLVNALLYYGMEGVAFNSNHEYLE